MLIEDIKSANERSDHTGGEKKKKEKKDCWKELKGMNIGCFFRPQPNCQTK